MRMGDLRFEMSVPFSPVARAAAPDRTPPIGYLAGLQMRKNYETFLRPRSVNLSNRNAPILAIVVNFDN